MRANDRDLIRGGHYGQRSCEPHLKAEHMAAPTNAAYVRKSLPTRSRPHMAAVFGVLHYSEGLASVTQLNDIRAAAEAIHREVRILNASTEQDIHTAFT